MNLTEVVDVNKHSELNRIGNEFDVRIKATFFLPPFPYWKRWQYEKLDGICQGSRFDMNELNTKGTMEA